LRGGKCQCHQQWAKLFINPHTGHIATKKHELVESYSPVLATLMGKGTRYREQFAQLCPVTANDVIDNAENRIINMVQSALKAFEAKQEELYNLGPGTFTG
jgi:hypothetical protein